MTYGLIGEKLTHSFSKEIHEMLGYEYELKELATDQVGDFLKSRDFRGINVTIPYKKAVIPYLDCLSDGARAIGAVNTVVNRNGKLYGYNTDLIGLMALIMRITGGRGLFGSKVLILGSGGTSLTAYVASKECGADTVYRVSRSGKDGCITYPDAEALHSDADFIINCTPNGMFPHADDEPLIHIEKFNHLSGVADCIYNPIRSVLVRNAVSRGISAEGGLYMLVSQAIAASELFFDRKLSADKCDSIFENILRGKENIVLIGMPSCGKTTVGNILAKRYGRVLIDTDNEIVMAAGKQIPQIFAEYGEKYFRELESKVISELSKKNGVIISTGGGAVLDNRNTDALRSNGRIYFIDRSPDKLIPTDDRPLSSSREAILKRYNERYGLYRSEADVIINGDGTPDEVASLIEADLNNKQRRENYDS